MSDFQVTYWRDLPSMVVARDDGGPTKALLAARFQEAIDEAAMRLGDTGADAYLDGWRRSDWESTEEGSAEVLERVVGELEASWPADRVSSYLDDLTVTS